MFNWLAFLTYALVTTITPGPNTISSMSCGSRKGFWRALPYNFGIYTGVTVIMSLCALFCSLLSSFLSRIKLPMLIIGAAYILYLAWSTFRSSGIAESLSTGDSFFSAVMLQFLNIKLVLYGIVSMEVYILPYYADNIPALLGFSLLMATFCFLSTLCWSAFGSVFRTLFSRHARIVNLIMALLLVYCAISLFFS